MLDWNVKDEKKRNCKNSNLGLLWPLGHRYTVKDKDDIKAPKLLVESPEGSFFLDFVSGGHTAGEADPELLVGTSNTHLYVRSLETTKAGESGLVARPLPMAFAKPVTLEYDPHTGARILGPVTHGYVLHDAVPLRQLFAVLCS